MPQDEPRLASLRGLAMIKPATLAAWAIGGLSLFIASAFLPQTINSRHNWHEEAFFGIHYDLHANAQDTELGPELTSEHLRERLRLGADSGCSDGLGLAC